MKFEFNKDRFLAHKGYDNLTAEKLNGTHPVYIFYAKENMETGVYDVLHFDWSMSSNVSIRTLKDVESDIARYNPEWVFKNELSKETISETTHLITGYYNLLNDEWHEIETKAVEALKNEDVFDSMVKAKVECSEIFFNDKELFLKNLEVASNKDFGLFIFHKDLEDNLNLKEIFSLIVDWFENEKAEVEKNTDKETGAVLVPIGRIMQHFEDKKVPDKDKDSKSNIRNLFGVMRAYDVFQTGFYDNLLKKGYDESHMKNIEKEDIKKRPEDFLQVSYLSNRLVNVLTKK